MNEPSPPTPAGDRPAGPPRPAPPQADAGLSPTVKRFLVAALVGFIAGVLLLFYSLGSVVTDAGSPSP